MICPPEYDYEVHWPLGVYDTTVNVACPKKANGEFQQRGHVSIRIKILHPGDQPSTSYNYNINLFYNSSFIFRQSERGERQRKYQDYIYKIIYTFQMNNT